MPAPVIFPHFNPVGPACPVCQTKANAPTVLVPFGEVEDGLRQSRQVHQECFALVEKMLDAEKQLANPANKN